MELVGETPYGCGSTDRIRCGCPASSSPPAGYWPMRPRTVAAAGGQRGDPARIVAASYAMPDVHWGYGFPIGGVAATDVDAGGVVSPGGVGFDISCGVRLLVSDLDRDRLAGRLPALMDALDRLVPRGLGGRGVWQLTGGTGSGSS